MLSTIRPALVLLGSFTLLTGVAYPAVVNGVSSVLFPGSSAGSLVVAADGTVLGSALIGQPFQRPEYFWPRPSATVPVPFNGAGSGGSNLGPSSPALRDAVAARVKTLALERVPVDLVTASASGLDPHVSPAAADFQVARVAAARGLSSSAVRALVEAHVEGRTFGVLGEPRVNVLELNLALDALAAGR